MHMLTIIAFAVLFWQAEQPGDWVIGGAEDVGWTLTTVLGQPLVLALAAWLVAQRALWRLKEHPHDPERAQLSHHRATSFLRGATLVGFAATVLLTRWPAWFAFGRITPALQIVGDLIVVMPFLVNLLILWTIAYPLEKTVRVAGQPGTAFRDVDWRFWAYLDFQVRHYFLVVAVPMALILFVADLTRGYEESLRTWTGWVWTPDAVLGGFAAGVFLVAPLMLCRIWRTARLEPGPVRDRLEAVCARLGLRFRDILVWKSGGIMINAAVMGLFARVRYVLLSDALLNTMTIAQIEAVFGHEAGHVRHRHIQHFLVFALVGWLLVAGIMEFLARLAAKPGMAVDLSLVLIEAIGVLVTVAFWGLGFGWLSRRFELQADSFGAQCATPPPVKCVLPCSVHSEGCKGLNAPGRVCMTGASVFASALHRVALLNGIPHEERSWRHSSIGKRIRFLMSLAGDPGRARRFDRRIRLVKRALLALAIVGVAISVYYWLTVPEPALLRLQVGTS